MFRAKIPLVGLVSIMLVVVLVSGALPAELEHSNNSVEQAKSTQPNTQFCFHQIVQHDGQQVGNSLLAKQKGQGALSAFIGAVTGATEGAITNVGHYLWNKSVIKHEIPDINVVGQRAKNGAIVGAASGAFFGAFLPV